MDNYNEISDEDILQASLKDPARFEVLVDRYQALFLKKITYILKSKEEAEDIVQDTFVKIYSYGHKFNVQEGASFKSWAYKILLNTCYTYCKKKKRDKQFIEFTDPGDIDLLSGKDEYERKLDLDHILSYISKIPLALQGILRLNVTEGKTYEDIAHIEGITVGAVRTRMHRAKKAFKKVVELYAK